ncbi:MAG: helix-turn-helix transcriptional regulator [Eubacterium sp.]|nr:helix-turn-helix transcriptional regulator [Eubacterium sp.]
MATEFEIISHGLTSYHIFFVNMLYRTPHVHKDYEVGIVLSGEMRMVTRGRSIELSQNDFWILNPFQNHEFICRQPALLLLLQISPSFFSSYFPQIENLDFSSDPRLANDDCSALLRSFLLEIAELSFHHPKHFELQAVAKINELFYHILELFPYTIIPEKEKNRNQNKAAQMRRIMNYIDEHYSQKLLLSKIAEAENLTLSYLSHFFKSSFGIPFQTYLLNMRCEKARRLLLLTELPLLDICISCGFSDMKYFNRGFQKQYGYLPRDYRMLFEHEKLTIQQNTMLTTQDILSPNASLAMLSRYLPAKTSE